MDINVNNLDLGYTQCEGLNTLVCTSGKNLITNLETNVANLKINWKGNDATVHINNLIGVHDVLVSVVTDAKNITAAAGIAMSNLQKVRNANGGTGSIGADLPSGAPESETLAKVEETTEYYCKPAAETDYNSLVEICNAFSTFKEDFKTKRDELMSNWTEGCDHGTAVTKFNNFEDNADTYHSILTSAKDNLNTAIENIKKVG